MKVAAFGRPLFRALIERWTKGRDMQIRFTDSVAGRGFSYRRGQVVTLPDAVAHEFIRCRQAVRHEDEVETATVSAPETAARRGRRRINHARR